MYLQKVISGSTPKSHGSATLVKRLYHLFYLFSLSNPRPRRMKLRDMMSRAVRSALANPDLDREAERFNRSVKSKTTFVLVFVFLYHWHKSENKITNKQLFLQLKTILHPCCQGPWCVISQLSKKTQPSFLKTFQMNYVMELNFYKFTIFLDVANFLQYLSLCRTIFRVEKWQH